MHPAFASLLAATLFLAAAAAWPRSGFDEVFSDRFEDSGTSECTTANWSTAVGLTPSDAETQDEANGHRRYGGPCGLRVAIDGSQRYLVDSTPASEGSYKVRFYAFLDEAGSVAVNLLESGDGVDDVFRIVYNQPSQGDLTLQLVDAGGTPTSLTWEGIGEGWHSIEIDWEAEAFATIGLSVDGAPDLSIALDTAGLSIVETRLGNIDGADTGGVINFDDFTSRRVSRPGRLPEGDASGDDAIDVADVIAIADELGGLAFAPGQPDCDENGSIDEADIECLVARIDAL